MATNKFDPTKYGATSDFDPTQYGATPFDPRDYGATPADTPTQGGFLRNTAEFGKGLLKGVGQSAFNIAKMVTEGPFGAPIGIGGFGPRPELKEPEILKAANTPQKAGKVVETIGEIVAPTPFGKQVAGESLINTARKIYQSVLKPSTTLSEAERLRVLQTGLDEGIALTKGGVQKAADLIDDLEMQLGKGIDKAAGIIRDDAGKIVSRTGEVAKIPLSFIKPYIDDVKIFFENTADVAFSEKSIQKLDQMY